MARLSSLPEEDQARLEVAAEWRLRLAADDSPSTHGEFRRWLERGADNRRAFDATASALFDVQVLADTPELLALRQAALQGAKWQVRRRWFSPKRLVRIAAVLVVAAIVGSGGASLWWRAYVTPTYVTERGERRAVDLPDGSHVLMDADSKIRVRFAKGAREITLDRGRARFDVIHDPRRPFSVAAGDRSVLDVGTVFEVERVGPQVLVTVLRGRVVVRALPRPGTSSSFTPITLAAGQTMTAGPAMAAQMTAPPVQAIAAAMPDTAVTQANLPSSTAWETGRLVFEDEPLATAVERLNRYTQATIIVDPDVASTRISGMFKAGDTEAFVSSITGYFPIRATALPDGRVELAATKAISR